MNQLLGFTRLLSVFKVPSEDSERVLIDHFLSPIVVKLFEQNGAAKFISDHDYVDIQVKLFDYLVVVHELLSARQSAQPWNASADSHKERGGDGEPVHQSHWRELFVRLTDILIGQMTRFFMLTDQNLQEMLIQSIVRLKDQISPEFAEDIVSQYCYQNRTLLPRKNGSSGLAVLKIVEVLKRIRGIDSIFALLDSEQRIIESGLDDPKLQPINVKSSTRIQVKKLQKTFYKELEPFQKEGINWNAFVWRVHADLDSDKYTNYKREEDEEQQVCRLFRK